MATVRIIKGRLYYDFSFKRVRCTETSGLEATKENRKKAEKYIELITAEIYNGVFQYEQHFPHGAKIEKFSPPKEDLPFNQYFADWMAGKVLKETTRAIGRVPSGSTFTHSSKIGSFPRLPGQRFAGSREPWWTRG
jgi:hypothetical protein